MVDLSYRKFLNEYSVKKFRNRLQTLDRSEGTLETYARIVHHFFRWLGVSPDVGISSGIDFTLKIGDYFDSLENLGPATKNLRMLALKRFFQINKVLVDWDEIEIPRKRRVEKTRLPTKEELREILSYADLRERALVLLALSSGLRIGSIASLRLKNIKPNGKSFAIIVPAEAAKGRQGYTTFVSEEAARALQSYLRSREVRGEKLGPESPLIADASGKALSADGIRQAWHRLLKAAGKDEKGRRRRLLVFHMLRHYFKTYATLSGIPSDLVESFMGHRSGVSQLYLRTDNPPEEVLKMLYENYRKAEKFLTIFPSPKEVEEAEERLKELEGRLKAKERELRASEAGWARRFEDLERRLRETERLLEGLLKASS